MAPIRTDPNTGILYELWDVGSPKAVFLLIHGLGAHSGRWQPMAEYFAARGIASYALELQGFGQTRGVRGHVESFETYYDDIRTLVNIIRLAHPHTQVFLVGESFGGLLSFLIVRLNPALFSGLICLSPAFSIKIQVSLLDYLQVFLNLSHNPQKQFKVRFVGDMCTRDPQYQEQIDHDFREHRLVSAQFVLNYFHAERQARRLSDSIDIPVLFLIPMQDKIVSSHASKIVFYRLQADDKQMIKYPGMFHALSVELGKERVFADILDWIDKKL